MDNLNNRSSEKTSTFFLVRHGESVANERGFIASSLSGAGKTVGLTSRGNEQVRAAAAEICRALRSQPPEEVVVVSSPFRRTLETAAEIINALIINAIGPAVTFITDPRFGERSFGNLEGSDADNYQAVWERDRAGLEVAKWNNWNVEALEAVQTRTQSALTELEVRYRGKTVVIVTHGDVASNILATDHGLPLRCHRDVYLTNAGIAKIKTRTIAPGPH
jgi:broad specificity phosphatase PhoE